MGARLDLLQAPNKLRHHQWPGPNYNPLSAKQPKTAVPEPFNTNIFTGS